MLGVDKRGLSNHNSLGDVQRRRTVMMGDTHVAVSESSNILQVAVSNGSDTLVFPWPLWERIVQYASYEMVSWAIANPEKYRQLMERQAALDAGVHLVG